MQLMCSILVQAYSVSQTMYAIHYSSTNAPVALLLVSSRPLTLRLQILHRSNGQVTAQHAEPRIRGDSWQSVRFATVAYTYQPAGVHQLNGCAVPRDKGCGSLHTAE